MAGIYKGAICKKMSNDVDKGLDQLDMGKSAMRGQMNKMRDQLKGMSWSSKDDVNAAMDAINSKQNDMIPDTKDADEVTDMINNCIYFNDTPYAKPSALVRSISSFCKKNAQKLMDEVAGSLPELNAAHVFDELLRHVKGAKISIIVDSIKKALSCLDSVCGSDTTEQYARLQSYLDECKLNQNGEFDEDDMLEWSGITDPDKQANFKNATKTTQDIYNKIDSNLNDSVDILKAAKSLF